jgi:hypothetical protein
MKKLELQQLIREEVRKVLQAQKLNEDFASPILRKLLSQKEYRTTIAGAFQKMARVALDKVPDSAITKMSPSAAYKELKKSGTAGPANLVVFYVSENGGINNYAKDSYSKKIEPGTLLAIASGDNKFYDVNYINYGSDKGSRIMSTGKSGDTLGVSKSGSGYGSTGLYNVKRVSEVADTAYLIDLVSLRSNYSTDAKTRERTIAKQGAIAFKSAAQFKKENLARYQDALAGRAANTDIDKLVLDSVQIVTKQISDAVAGKTMSDFGDVLLGTDKRGRNVTASDATNILNRLMQDFARYSAAQKEVERYKDSGRSGMDSYAQARIKEYALSVKTIAQKIKTMNYAW